MADTESSSDDLSGLTGFFFYMFIVHPITAWILQPGRFDRSKSIMYAIGFLATLAAIKTGEFLLLCASLYTTVLVCGRGLCAEATSSLPFLVYIYC